MRSVAAAFAVLVVAAFGVPQAASAANQADIADFTGDNVSAIVREAGGTNVTVEKEADVTFVHFELGGMPFSYSIRLCGTADSKPACMGLLMAIGFETTERYSLETFNGFNKNVPIATAISIDSNKMVFARLLFSPGGLSRDNIKANMGLMVAAPVVFGEYLKSQVIASTDTSAQARLTQVATDTGMKAFRLTGDQIKALMDEKAAAMFRAP